MGLERGYSAPRTAPEGAVWASDVQPVTQAHMRGNALIDSVVPLFFRVGAIEDSREACWLDTEGGGTNMRCSFPPGVWVVSHLPALVQMEPALVVHNCLPVGLCVEILRSPASRQQPVALFQNLKPQSRVR